jgi:hypothetical protein
MGAVVVSRDRVRAFRERRRHGLVQLTVTVDEVALTETLCATGFLQCTDPKPEEIESALEKLLAFWIEAEK